MAQSGFELSDDIQPVEPDGEAEESTRPDIEPIQLVGYRRVTLDGPLLLLELAHVSAQHLITGAVWRPDDLLTGDGAGAVETAARFYQTWRYDPSTNPQAFAGAIVQEVRQWLAALDGAERTTIVPPSGPVFRPRSIADSASERSAD
jgi:hypothetical protein